MLKIMIKEENLDNPNKTIAAKYSLNENLSKNLDNLIENNTLDDFSLNMKKIQEQIVPIIKDCDIFISYSHNDKNKAAFLAEQLQSEGYSVFIDYIFWKNIDDALKKYNKTYNKNQDGSYDYAKANKAAASFYMILSDAIVETINKTKVFIFIKGKSTIDERSCSPWLYLENKIVSNLPNAKLKEDGFYSHFFYENYYISFPISTDNYIEANNYQDIIKIMSIYDW